jgi:hypothetical protein
MVRILELAIFLAPALAFLLWRVAVARGLDGPPPRQIALIFAGLLALGAGLAWFAVEDRLPPGLYVPAELVDGRIVQGHAR